MNSGILSKGKEIEQFPHVTRSGDFCFVCLSCSVALTFAWSMIFSGEVLGVMQVVSGDCCSGDSLRPTLLSLKSIKIEQAG